MKNAVYAYVRQKGTNKILVVLNLSDREQTISIKDNSLSGQPLNVFIGRKETLNGKSWNMKPWGYAVYVY